MSEFDKAVKHVKTCLFWDFVDGQWLEKLYTPLDKDFFSRLMQGVVEAHEAESANLREQLEHERQNSRSRLERIDQLKAENAKLREFIDLKETCWKYVGWCDECPYNGVDDEQDNCNCTVQEKIDSLVRELGIEVPE